MEIISAPEADVPRDLRAQVTAVKTGERRANAAPAVALFAAAFVWSPLAFATAAEIGATRRT